jgi:predicted dehydrogenase
MLIPFQILFNANVKEFIMAIQNNHKTSASDKVVLALIGAGGRGTQVILSMQQCTPGVEVKYVCEVDQQRGGRAIDELSKQQGYKPERIEDMRYAFEDKEVDAAVICTPEHWHSLAAIRAMQAGKDVYVEKNISLNLSEGRKMVLAAKKYNRIVQCGTQNRSAEYAASARQYLQSGKLGNIVHVKCFCMLPGGNPMFLKPDSPVPEGLNWDFWLGPAPKRPYNISRHKGWHVWWEYSGGRSFAGDASHILDLARLVLGDPDHPESVYATGRVLFDDNQETPDIQTITYDYTDYTLSVVSSEFGNYLTKSSPEVRYGNEFPDWKLNSTRIEIYGTEGKMYLGRHGGGWQVFGANKEIIAQEYGMFPDTVHQVDFIEAIRSRNLTNGNIEQGHRSAALIHMGNAAYRVGEKQLYFDAEKEMFTNSEEANIIAQGKYRAGFEIPEII